MLEQDLQLTRLIVDKLTDLEQRKQQTSWQLTEAQERLDKVEALKQERSAYEGVLERAAALLGRDDLRVEIETPPGDAELAEKLRGELSVLDAEEAQYLELVDELKKRAPELISAAAGTASPEVHSLLTGSADAPAPEAEALPLEPEEAPAEFEAEAEAATAALASADSEPFNSEATEVIPSAAVTEVAPETEVESALPQAEAEAATAFSASSNEPEYYPPLPTTPVAEAPAPPASSSKVGWPEVGDSASLPPAVSFASADWDDADAEVTTHINYQALADEDTSHSNGHYSNGHYGDVEAEDAVAEDVVEIETEEPAAAEPEADAVVASSNGSNGHYDLDESPASSTVASDADEAESLAAAAEELAEDEGVEVHAAYADAPEDEDGFVTLAYGAATSADVESPVEEHAVSGQTFYASSGAVPSESPFTSAYASFHATQAEQATDVMEPAVEEDADERERQIRLSRFDLAHLNSKIDGGQMPVFVIDATAVLERIPHYDRYHLALDENAARDEMVRDFSFLAHKLQGDFHLVFNDPHVPGVALDPHIYLEHGDTENGEQNPGDRRIQELVLDQLEHEHQVALVTSDPTLMGLFKGENVLVFSLGEFFLT